MLGTDGKVVSRPTKRQSLTVLLQNCEKSVVKHFIEKPVLISWICLQYFAQGCLRKHVFISNLFHTRTELISLINFIISEDSVTLHIHMSCHKDLNLIYFEKHYFCTFASSTNLVLKVIPIEAGEFL